MNKFLLLLVFSIPLLGSPDASAANFSAPAPLPGMTGIFAATGKQEKPQLAKGDTTFLAVWSDSRSALASNGSLEVGGGGPYSGAGLGTMNDIYAARLDQNGNVIDHHPIVVSEGSYNQGYPQVAWNGQNWLVVWYQELENDYQNYEIRGVRVSPAGVVLDANPFKLGATSNNLGSFPAKVLFNGTNWVVFWQAFNASQTARSIFAARVAPDGQVLDPNAIAVYNHSTQNLTSPDVAFNGSEYLLVFDDLGDHHVYGVRLTGNLALVGSRFIINTFSPSLPSRPRVASNGNGYLVVWDEHPFSGNVGGVTGSRVSATGQVLDPDGLVVDDNVGVSDSFPTVAWNGTKWFVTYTSGYEASTGSYTNQTIDARRVSSAGAVLDANAIRLSNPAFTAVLPAIVTGAGGAVQVLWLDLRADQDIYGAGVTDAGTAGNQKVVGLGAPRQSHPRLAFGADIFLAVFQRQIAGKAQVFAQRLNSVGQALDAQPFAISEGPNESNRNPAVAFNGQNFLVVWQRTQTDSFGNQTPRIYGRRVSPAGQTLGGAFPVMAGETPDVAALGDTFLTVAIQPAGEIRSVNAIRVDAAGTVLGTNPSTVSGNFCFAPRVASFADRWLIVWEYHSNHDDSTSYIRAAFADSTAAISPSFQVALSNNPTSGQISYDHTPHLAVAGLEALIVWSDNDNGENNIKGRRIQANGVLLGSNFGFLVSQASGSQSFPAVSWDGSNYIATWLDHRNEQFPVQPRGDIYGARLGPKGAILERFAVANSPAAEENPSLLSANGVTLFAYSSFYDDAPYSAMRVTTRAATFAP
jgi:hypothetical protein